MRCSNCAAEISSRREFCPSCGTPTGSASRQPRLQRRERTPEELRRNRRNVGLFAGGLLVIALATGKLNPLGWLPFGGHGVNITISDDKPAPVTIDADQLYRAYADDQKAADKRFRGREMVVSGTFLRTVPDGYGSIDMRLKTSNPEAPLGVDLNGVSVDAATKLQPDEQVTVSCRRVSGSGNDHWLQDCVIQPPEGDGPDQPALPSPPAPPSAPDAAPPSPPTPPQG